MPALSIWQKGVPPFLLVAVYASKERLFRRWMVLQMHCSPCAQTGPGQRHSEFLFTSEFRLDDHVSQRGIAWEVKKLKSVLFMLDTKVSSFSVIVSSSHSFCGCSFNFFTS